MKQDGALELLNRIGAVKTEGHYVYTSKKHGSAYVDKDRVFAHPDVMCILAEELAERLRHLSAGIVLGPAYGAIALASWVAYHLKMHKPDVEAAYAVKSGDGFEVKSAFAAKVRGKRVIVVEDILTTGKSAGATVQAVLEAGGHVTGVGALVNRGGVRPNQLGLPNGERLIALVDVAFDMYDPADCRLCREGRPVNTDLGHGRQYILDQQSAAPAAGQGV